MRFFAGTVLQRGDSNAAVADMQLQLIKIGLGPVLKAAGGIFDARTEAAVRALQREQGLEENGTLDSPTIAKIYSFFVPGQPLYQVSQATIAYGLSLAADAQVEISSQVAATAAAADAAGAQARDAALATGADAATAQAAAQHAAELVGQQMSQQWASQSPVHITASGIVAGGGGMSIVPVEVPPSAEVPPVEAPPKKSMLPILLLAAGAWFLYRRTR